MLVESMSNTEINFCVSDILSAWQEKLHLYGGAIMDEDLVCAEEVKKTEIKLYLRIT